MGDLSRPRRASGSLVAVAAAGLARDARRPLPEIAAFQWESANRIALDDLQKIDRSRWTTVTYEELAANPRAVIERLTKFIGIGVDAGLEKRLAAPLPPSRQTHTPPDAKMAAASGGDRAAATGSHAHGDAPAGPQRRVLKPRFTSRAECLRCFIFFLVSRWDSSDTRSHSAFVMQMVSRASREPVLGSRRQTNSSPFSF